MLGAVVAIMQLWNGSYTNYMEYDPDLLVIIELLNYQY